MISTGNDGLVKIWDLKEGHLLYTLYGHKYGSTTAAVFSAQGDFFATGGADSQVMVWKSNLETIGKLHEAIPAIENSRPQSRANIYTEPSTAAQHPTEHPFASAKIHSASGGVTFKSKPQTTPSVSPVPKQQVTAAVVATPPQGNETIKPKSPDIVNVGTPLFKEVSCIVTNSVTLM